MMIEIKIDDSKHKTRFETSYVVYKLCTHQAPGSAD